MVGSKLALPAHSPEQADQLVVRSAQSEELTLGSHADEICFTYHERKSAFSLAVVQRQACRSLHGERGRESPMLEDGD